MNSTPLAVPGRWRTAISPQSVGQLAAGQCRQLRGRLEAIDRQPIAQQGQRAPTEREAHRVVVSHDLVAL
ncbi:hypothetical protein [Burkholderia multivorans]|uniref:hypothetical protein n=1 Tax=Burkholderia multivorans TaxID=87883 RepID=UPI001FC835C2|nr:hypothetical protein [Burkholderia multivorans]MDN7866041.1 hypothetical protein [Burkholderia multivorans]MDN8051447.1 hypothetical protein [Burkholderia multivorans]MDN8054076.1 hypothetical protein [Burkholderia multivorans]